MQSYFSIESETTHRRREWERSTATASLTHQLRPRSGRVRWAQTLGRVLPGLRSRCSTFSAWCFKPQCCGRGQHYPGERHASA
jgi:hypothetical protein